MRYKLLFDKINVINSGCLKKTELYIDIETLEIFRGLGDLSKKLKKSRVQCCEYIAIFRRINGRLIEKFNEWQKLDNREKYNKPIDTKKEVLIFLDGNRSNFDISNLKKISRSYDACMSFLGLWSKNKELNNTSLNVVNLYKETKRARNERAR